MGTYYADNWHTAADVRAELISEVERNPEVTLHRHHAARTQGEVHLWMDITIKSKGMRLICLDLIRYEPGAGWGYKPMDETVGPYYYTVPATWLDEVPDPKLGYSTDWRTRVREALAA